MIDNIEDQKGLILGRKIYECYPDHFGSYMITGKRGIGKTSYSLKCLHEALLRLGYSDSEAWPMALDSVQFSIPSVIRYLEQGMKKKKIALIWDDCRIHAAGSTYFLQMKLVNKLGGMLDMVRSAVSTIILTTPSSQGLLGILSTYDDYFIKVRYSPEGGNNRISTGYIWSTLPSGQKRVNTRFRDSFSCWLPEDIYEKYTVMRRHAFSKIIKDIDKILADENIED